MLFLQPLPAWIRSFILLNTSSASERIQKAKKRQSGHVFTLWCWSIRKKISQRRTRHPPYPKWLLTSLILLHLLWVWLSLLRNRTWVLKQQTYRINANHSYSLLASPSRLQLHFLQPLTSYLQNAQRKYQRAIYCMLWFQQLRDSHRGSSRTGCKVSTANDRSASIFTHKPSFSLPLITSVLNTAFPQPREFLLKFHCSLMPHFASIRKKELTTSRASLCPSRCTQETGASEKTNGSHGCVPYWRSKRYPLFT